MSIIYDALQKTQLNRSNRSILIKKSFRNMQWFDIGMLCVIIILFLAVIYAYYPHLLTFIKNSEHKLAQLHSPQKTLPKVIPVASKPKNPLSLPTIYATGTSGKMTLNGVFLSGQEKFAMINNQTFHIGDNVEGMKIIDIQFDKVKLRDEKTNLIIRTAA